MCVYVCVCAQMYLLCMYLCAYVSCTVFCMYIGMYVCTYACMYVCVCIYIYTYLHIHTHTFIHRQMYHRADTSSRDLRGHTPLLAAMLTRDKHMVTCLLSGGASIHGSMAVYTAAVAEDDEMLQIALLAGADASEPGT